MLISKTQIGDLEKQQREEFLSACQSLILENCSPECISRAKPDLPTFLDERLKEAETAGLRQRQALIHYLVICMFVDWDDQEHLQAYGQFRRHVAMLPDQDDKVSVLAHYQQVYQADIDAEMSEAG